MTTLDDIRALQRQVLKPVDQPGERLGIAGLGSLSTACFRSTARLLEGVDGMHRALPFPSRKRGRRPVAAWRRAIGDILLARRVTITGA
jgi:hypothetical protein